MRFKEFLLQEETMHMTLEQGLESIKSHCRRFLSDIRGSGGFLYRGMQIPVVDQVIVMDHLRERHPRDSSPGYNVMFNAGIEAAFDIPMVRGKTVFSSGDINETAAYGNAYFMFPQGDYKYMWSPQVVDSYVSDTNIMDRFIKELGVEVTPRRIADAFSYIYLRSNENISRAAMNVKLNDVMVEEAFRDADMEVTAEDVERALKKVFEKMYFVNQDIKEAIEQGKEIMVYDSDGNYFVPRALVQETIDTDPNLEGQSPEEYLTNYFW